METQRKNDLLKLSVVFILSGTLFDLSDIIVTFCDWRLLHLVFVIRCDYDHPIPGDNQSIN